MAQRGKQSPRFVLIFIAMLAVTALIVACGSEGSQPHECRAQPLAGAAASPELAALIAGRPLQPTDYGLMHPDFYPQGPAIDSNLDRTLNKRDREERLRQTLECRFPNQQSTVDEALALLDDDNLKDIVPDDKLRAALVLLRGTAADNAVDVVVSGQFFEFVEFGPLPAQLVGAVIEGRVSGRRGIRINDSVRGEEFRTLSVILAHEAGHAGSTGPGSVEELVVQMIEARIWAELPA